MNPPNDPKYEEIAKAVSAAADTLGSLSRDELAKVAEALGKSPTDVERLVRLSKLSAKATSVRLAGPGTAAYHY